MEVEDTNLALEEPCNLNTSCQSGCCFKGLCQPSSVCKNSDPQVPSDMSLETEASFLHSKVTYEENPTQRVVRMYREGKLHVTVIPKGSVLFHSSILPWKRFQNYTFFSESPALAKKFGSLLSVSVTLQDLKLWDLTFTDTFGKMRWRRKFTEQGRNIILNETPLDRESKTTGGSHESHTSYPSLSELTESMGLDGFMAIATPDAIREYDRYAIKRQHIPELVLNRPDSKHLKLLAWFRFGTGRSVSDFYQILQHCVSKDLLNDTWQEVIQTLQNRFTPDFISGNPSQSLQPHEMYGIDGKVVVNPNWSTRMELNCSMIPLEDYVSSQDSIVSFMKTYKVVDSRLIRFIPKQDFTLASQFKERWGFSIDNPSLPHVRHILLNAVKKGALETVTVDFLGNGLETSLLQLYAYVPLSILIEYKTTFSPLLQQRIDQMVSLTLYRENKPLDEEIAFAVMGQELPELLWVLIRVMIQYSQKEHLWNFLRHVIKNLYVPAKSQLQAWSDQEDDFNEGMAQFLAGRADSPPVWKPLGDTVLQKAQEQMFQALHSINLPERLNVQKYVRTERLSIMSIWLA